MEACRSNTTWEGLEGLRPVLRSFLARQCTDENEVDDVVQETYLRAARYRAGLVEPRRLKAWTLRIAANVLMDRRQRASRYVGSFRGPGTPEEDGSPSGATPEPAAPEEEPEPPLTIGRFEVERADAVGLLRRVLGGLRDDDRRVLDSYYGGSQSCRRTGDECGIPAHLVKVRLFRARQRLCRAMRHRIALEHARPAASGDPAASRDPAVSRDEVCA
jgi:RNA polymerase sigma factor (sigma-70 family)